MEQESVFAFLCTTPFQIFNALRFIMNDSMESCGHSDLYIYGGFANSISLYERLLNSGVFNHVYYIAAMPKAKFKSKIYGLIILFWKIIFSRVTLQKYATTKIDFTSKYEYLVYSSTPPIVLMLCRTLKHQSAIGIDDGLASYYCDDLANDMHSPVFHLVNRIFFGGTLIEKFEKIFLNNSEMYDGALEHTKVFSLSGKEWTEEKIETIYRIFGYKDNCIYQNHRVVYLMMVGASKTFPINYTKETEVLKILDDCSHDFLVIRRHPRQAEIDTSEYVVDNISNMWELECDKQITDDSILVSVCSTAQFTPKILYNKEPYLIFVYKIVLEANDIERNAVDNMENLINKLKNSYKNPEKIFVPETFEDFIHILLAIKGNAI